MTSESPTRCEYPQHTGKLRNPARENFENADLFRKAERPSEGAGSAVGGGLVFLPEGVFVYWARGELGLVILEAFLLFEIPNGRASRWSIG